MIDAKSMPAPRVSQEQEPNMVYPLSLQPEPLPLHPHVVAPKALTSFLVQRTVELPIRARRVWQLSSMQVNLIDSGVQSSGSTVIGYEIFDAEQGADKSIFSGADFVYPLDDVEADNAEEAVAALLDFAASKSASGGPARLTTEQLDWLNSESQRLAEARKCALRIRDWRRRFHSGDGWEVLLEMEKEADWANVLDVIGSRNASVAMLKIESSFSVDLGEYDSKIDPEKYEEAQRIHDMLFGMIGFGRKALPEPYPKRIVERVYNGQVQS